MSRKHAPGRQVYAAALMGVSLGSQSSETRLATRLRVTRAGVAAAVVFSLLFAYYAWTATSSGNPFNKPSPLGLTYQGVDYYNLQADAFLHGRLWVDIPIDQQLLAAENPYALDIPNSVPGMADGSFYNDKYYLTWGPAPALTTFLPPRLIGLRIHENLAITLYCFFGVIFFAMTLTLLVSRLIPGTPRVVVWMGSATMALGSAIPWILRSPLVYQAAISAAFFFMMAGLLVLVRELLREEPPRRAPLAAAGTLLGLAVLSRPTMVFVVVGVAVLSWILRPDARRKMMPLIVGIPVIAGVIFMVYNMARFSGPLDFGNKWQTSGTDLRHYPFNQIANIPPALYAYLLAPLHLTVGFPYIHLPPPPLAPFASDARYRGEPTGSMLWAAPFVLLALAFVARQRRHATGNNTSPVRPIVLTMLGIGVLVVFAGAYGVPGYTERYELDFMPWIIMAATLGWAALIDNATTPRRAMRWRRTGITLAAWGALVGVAVSFTGYYNSLSMFDRDRYQALERAFSPLPTLVTKFAGRPMIAGIQLVMPNFIVQGGYTTLDISGVGLSLAPERFAELTIISPSKRHARLTLRAFTKASGTFTVFQAGAGEEPSALVRHARAVSLGLRLKRGVNYVYLGVTAGTDIGPPADGSPLVVQLDDIQLR